MVETSIPFSKEFLDILKFSNFLYNNSRLLHEKYLFFFIVENTLEYFCSFQYGVRSVSSDHEENMALLKDLKLSIEKITYCEEFKNN